MYERLFERGWLLNVLQCNWCLTRDYALDLEYFMYLLLMSDLKMNKKTQVSFRLASNLAYCDMGKIINSVT